MKKIYHITPTGQVRQCYASKQDCRYGAGKHYYSPAKAKEAVERTLTKEYSLTSTVNKKEAAKVEKSEVLSKIKNYKSASVLDKKFDETMSAHDTVEDKESFLKAIGNNANTSEKTLMKIASLSAHFNSNVIETTKNRRLLELAYLNKYTDVRKAALENSLTTDNDLYAVTLRYNETYYKRQYITKLQKAGYSTSHIKNQKQYNNTDHDARSIEKFINTYSKKYNSFDKLTDEDAKNIQKFLEDKKPAEYKEYIRLTIDGLRNSEKMDKYHAITKTKLKVANSKPKQKPQQFNSVPLNRNVPNKYSQPNKINTENHTVNDVTKLKQFKNNKPMASYEDSIELQDRWDKGLQNLPVEIQKEILRKKPQNSQEGLRAVVDIFKTTDTQGQMAKNGLSNFVNHIENLKKKNINDGYIAVDEPEFKTPSGLIKVEEHIGNRDYGEKITFRINGEKFEIGKPMLTDNWTSFIHIQENAPEEPVKKKSFWAKIFSKDD